MKQKQTVLSGAAFLKRLNSHPYENIHILKSVERELVNLRGYIHKPPKPHAPAILLVSGGIDSIVAWGWLLHRFGLAVYPLYIQRGTPRSEKEKQSVLFFSRWFKERFPSSARDAFIFSTNTTPPELGQWTNQEAYKKYHPSALLRQIEEKDNPFAPIQFNPLQPMPLLFPVYGLMYAQYLKNRLDLAINTIYTGNLPGDGTLIPYQTLTSLRLSNLLFIQASGNRKLQVSSPFFEKESGTWIEKPDVIKLGMTMNIPMEKTWSCYLGYRYHCGVCHSCFERKKQFLKVNFCDPSLYKDQSGNTVRRTLNMSRTALRNLLQYMRKKGGI
jgi:7-cyano-7-deazaguanine synthase in queuosine biosynthesis